MIKTNVQFANVYENLSTLLVYFQKNNYFEIGKNWFKTIEKNDKNQFLKTLDEKNSLPYISYLYVLVWKSPYQQDLGTFLSWLKGLSATEIEILLTPYLSESEGTHCDYIEFRDYYVLLLTHWNELCSFDDSIYQYLEEKAGHYEQLATIKTSQDLIEQATNGVYIDLDQSINEIVLVPSFHIAPFNRIFYLNNLLFILFSVNVLKEDSNAPSSSLVRLTKALGDEKRLRILKTISKEPMSLTEISRAVKITSSHLHYHLTLMRAAGLVRIINQNKTDLFTVRPGVFSTVEKSLEDYVYSDHTS